MVKKKREVIAIGYLLNFIIIGLNGLDYTRTENHDFKDVEISENNVNTTRI